MPYDWNLAGLGFSPIDLHFRLPTHDQAILGFVPIGLYFTLHSAQISTQWDKFL